jgi:hypothetical protein
MGWTSSLACQGLWLQVTESNTGYLSPGQNEDCEALCSIMTKNFQTGMVVHICNPSYLEPETGKIAI